MSIPPALSSEIFIDDISKKSFILKEKRLDYIGRKNVLMKSANTLPGEKYRYLPIPVVIDALPGKGNETSAVVMDNFNKRKSLKRDTLLSPGHRRKMRKLPY